MTEAGHPLVRSAWACLGNMYRGARACGCCMHLCVSKSKQLSIWVTEHKRSRSTKYGSTTVEQMRKAPPCLLPWPSAPCTQITRLMSFCIQHGFLKWRKVPRAMSRREYYKDWLGESDQADLGVGQPPWVLRMDDDLIPGGRKLLGKGERRANTSNFKMQILEALRFHVIHQAYELPPLFWSQGNHCKNICLWIKYMLINTYFMPNQN